MRSSSQTTARSQPIRTSAPTISSISASISSSASRADGAARRRSITPDVERVGEPRAARGLRGLEARVPEQALERGQARDGHALEHRRDARVRRRGEHAGLGIGAAGRRAVGAARQRDEPLLGVGDVLQGGRAGRACRAAPTARAWRRSARRGWRSASRRSPWWPRGGAPAGRSPPPTGRPRRARRAPPSSSPRVTTPSPYCTVWSHRTPQYGDRRADPRRPAAGPALQRAPRAPHRRPARGRVAGGAGAPPRRPRAVARADGRPPAAGAAGGPRAGVADGRRPPARGRPGAGAGQRAGPRRAWPAASCSRGS